MVKRFWISENHKRIVSRKTLLKVLSYLDTHDISTPLLLMDREKVMENATSIGQSFLKAKVFYAVKANGDRGVLSLLRDLDIGFEIASEGELALMKELNIDPSRIITSNPVKSVSFIRSLFDYGVRYFAFDSLTELYKLEEFAPSAVVYVRLSVPNEGAEWPLSKKFGVELDDALYFMKRARDRARVVPGGITFHVGSQCMNVYNWCIAIDKARRLWEMCRDEGIDIKMLNIGGGYPISYTRLAPCIEEVEREIRGYLKEKFPRDVEIFLEPGRAVVGDAGIMVTRILGIARRGFENWVYLDVGVFNGLMESIGGIKYAWIPERPGEEVSTDEEHTVLDRYRRGRDLVYKKWTIAGPSCDSMDVIDKNVEMPASLAPGGLMLIPSAGAYTVSYASEFNGFPLPRVKII